MRSRLGFKPNGLLTVDEPKKHFQESDFVKAIDEWSENLKDNPVPHFAAKIKLKQVNVFPYYGVTSTRKYEDRQLRDQREKADPNKYNRHPHVAWNSVNAWNYNLDEKDANFTVILEDTVYSEGCGTCRESCEVSVRCYSCGGKGVTSERVYGNNGSSRDIIVNCVSCVGRGHVYETCPTCSGMGGFVNYIVCDVAYTYPKTTAYYCHDDILPQLNKVDFEKHGWDLHSEVTTAKELVNFVQGPIRDQVIAKIVEFVNAHDSQHQRFLRESTQYGYSHYSLVRFEYDNGSEYTVAIYGDNNAVYAPESPISQSAERILDEANDLLINHDFSAASKVIEMLSNMGQREDMLDDIVDKFKENLGLALHHKAQEIKGELVKSHLQYEAQQIGNKNINPSKTFPIVTELLCHLALPLLVGVGGAVLDIGYNSQDALINMGVNGLVASCTGFLITHLYSRKSGISYTKAWKYLVQGSLMGFCALLAVEAGTLFPILSLMGIGTFLTMLGVSRANDRKAIHLSDVSFERFQQLNAHFKPIMAELKKFMPRDEFNYVNTDLKKGYQIAARELDECLRSSEEEAERNLLADHKKIPQAA